MIRLKAAPTAAPAGSNGTGPKAPAGEKAKVDALAEESSAEARPEGMASG